LLAGGSFESIVSLPNSLTIGAQLQVLVDNGDTVWYNNGTISKDLAASNQEKFRSDIVTLGAAVSPLPVVGTTAGESLTGSAGNDRLEGLAGRDTITGGAGNDVIIGGMDTDVLTGGAGRDRFTYTSIREGRDFITDFTVGEDTIVLTQVFQGLNLTFGSAIAGGYLSFADSSAGGLVRVDLDGTAGGTYRAITLAALTGVSANRLNNSNNFVL
jgi:Ca2+-binding RTX toxin-like protein